MGEDPREQRAKCHQFLMKFLRLQSTIRRHLAKLPLVKLIAEEEKEKEEEEGEEKKKKKEKEEKKKEEKKDNVRRLSLRKLKL